MDRCVHCGDYHQMFEVCGGYIEAVEEGIIVQRDERMKSKSEMKRVAVGSPMVMAEKYNDLQLMVEKLINCKACQCGDVGYSIVQGYDGEPAQEQCEFCYTDDNSRYNAIQEAAKLIGWEPK